MQKLFNEIISHLTIWTCTICTIFCSVFIDIQTEWLNILISFIISLITSYGVFYFTIKGIFRLVYKRKSREFYLEGTWYIAYYGDYKRDHYLRFGKLVMRQDYEQIAIEQLSSHSPKIKNNVIIQDEFRDDEESEIPSTGYGFAKIYREARIVAGIYFLTRSAQQTVAGMFHCRINDVNKGELCGEFITTEHVRPYNRPVNGKLRFFRDKKSRLDFCNNLIKSTKEN